MSLITNSSAWASDEHRMFAETTRKLFDAEMAPNVDKWAEQGIVDRDFWRKVGEQGVMGGSIAEEYGGFGGGIGFDALTVYEQGRTGDTGWGYGIQSIVIHYLDAYGSEEQKKKWLPRLISGESVAAIAMTEPGTGSDLQNLQTYAEKDGNHYTINGSKIFITNGHTADIIVIVTKTDRSAGAKGVSLIVLETEDAEGFRRGRNLKKLGMKGSDTAEL
ncbi:MAG: acyl-CoA dehydrogenase family protein, partial [Nitratireductor sp.]